MNKCRFIEKLRQEFDLQGVLASVYFRGADNCVYIRVKEGVQEEEARAIYDKLIEELNVDYIVKFEQPAPASVQIFGGGENPFDSHFVLGM